MKSLKIALSLAVLAMTGCANLQGPVVYDSEVGQVREAADAQRQNGELKWHNGTGIVYSRNLNQCGRNCADQAELALKMDRERAQQEAEGGSADYKRAVAREKEGYRRQAIMTQCSRGIQLRQAVLEDKARDAVLSYGYGSKESLKANQEFVKFNNQSLRLLNECVKYGLTQK